MVSVHFGACPIGGITVVEQGSLVFYSVLRFLSMESVGDSEHFGGHKNTSAIKLVCCKYICGDVWWMFGSGTCSIFFKSHTNFDCAIIGTYN